MARRKLATPMAVAIDMGMGCPSPHPFEVTTGGEDKGAQDTDGPTDREAEDTMLRFAGRVPGSDYGSGGGFGNY